MIVPPLCAACREPEFSGGQVCPECRAMLVPLSDPRCERCGAPVVRPVSSCGECQGRGLAFDGAWAAFHYGGVSRGIVTALKLRGHVAVARFMAAEIAARVPEGLARATLVPVPAHPRRRRRDGFNQAGALARALGAQTGQPVRDLLVRAGGAVPQVGLERSARLANARGSVRSRSVSRPPERAVVVDDVYTTGATLDACAVALRGSGVAEVSAVTFARVILA